MIISGYFFVIGCLFTAMGVYTVTRFGWKKSIKRYLWVTRNTGDSSQGQNAYVAIDDDDDDDSLELPHTN